MRPTLMVIASTYPRWEGDPEPGFVHELSKRLTGRFNVIAVVPGAPGAVAHEVLDGVEIIRYRYAPRRFETLVNNGGIVTNLRIHRWKLLLVPGFVLAQAWKIWRLLRTRKVDVIHAHWLLPQGLIAAALAHFSSHVPPYMVTSHGADLFALRGRSMDRLKRLVVRRAAAVTVVSPAMEKSLASLDVDLDKVRVLPMGVDMGQRFTPDGRIERTNNEILFVGRLVEKKGVRYLIEAMPAILEAMPGAVLTIVGFGPEEASLRVRTDELGLGSRVHFLGAKPQGELPGLYRRAAVFVAPFVEASSGDQEGLGLVSLEALGCGCPVVMSELPATRDVLLKGAGCIYVAPGNSDVLAKAIVEVLLHRDVHLRGAESQRQEASRKFDWVNVSQGYSEILQGMLQCR